MHSFLVLTGDRLEIGERTLRRFHHSGDRLCSGLIQVYISSQMQYGLQVPQSHCLLMASYLISGTSCGIGLELVKQFSDLAISQSARSLQLLVVSHPWLCKSLSRRTQIVLSASCPRSTILRVFNRRLRTLRQSSRDVVSTVSSIMQALDRSVERARGLFHLESWHNCSILT